MNARKGKNTYSLFGCDNDEFRRGWIITGVAIAASTTLALAAYLAQANANLSVGLGLAAAVIGFGGLTEGSLRCADALHAEAMRLRPYGRGS